MMRINTKLILISALPLSAAFFSCQSSMKGLSNKPGIDMKLPALTQTKANLDKVMLEDIPESLSEAEVVHGAGTNQGRYTLINLDSTANMGNYSSMMVEWDSINQMSMMNLTLENVEIIGSRVRNTAERNGMVNVDFVLSVPKTLLHKKRMLGIFPIVLRGETVDSLQEVRFTGEEFRRKQELAYLKYDNLMRQVIPDTADFYTNFVDYKGFEKYIEQSNRKYDGLQRRMEDWERKKGEETLLGKRFHHFNDEQKYYENLYNSEVHQTKGDNEGKSWKRILPHYWLVRDEKVSEKYYLRKMHELQAEIDGLEKIDSAELVKDFYLTRKIEKNDELKELCKEYHNKMIPFPYNDYARLDSVVTGGEDILFFYSHKVKADANSNRIYITATGQAVNYENDVYVLPPTDTLTFLVSSMNHFIEDKTRYVEKIIKRDLEVNFSANLAFHVGSAEVREDLGNNRAELEKVMKTSYDILTDTLYVLDGIRQVAYSSPEGSVGLNSALALRRGEAVGRYLTRKLLAMGDTMAVQEYVYDENTGKSVRKERKNPIPELFKKAVIQAEGEDWERLTKMIAADNSGELIHKEQILKLIEQYKNPDVREYKIAATYPAEYHYIRNTYYNKLRRVDFKYMLRRKGMLKETMVTNVVDTVYESGLALLKEKRYEEALEKLRPYVDVNTAVAYLSLGYDRAAERVLNDLEAGANVLYLRAVVAARLGKDREAAKNLLDACGLDSKLRHRTNLDPELAELVKRYNIFGDNF